MTSHRLLGAIFLALSVAMIAWDILMAGRIAQLRRIPRGFQAITGIASLLLVPALVVAYTAQSLLYGRAIFLVAWLWPFTTLLFVLQTIYALALYAARPRRAGRRRDRDDGSGRGGAAWRVRKCPQIRIAQE